MQLKGLITVLNPVFHDEWFKKFVRGYPRAEVVGNIIKAGRIPTDFDNADFFFENRQFVAEQKTLEISRMSKVQAFIDDLRENGELPLSYHPRPLNEIIKDHPDKEKLNLGFLKEITKRLRKDFTDANRQIRETKQKFQLPSSCGLLILTNISLPELNPSIVWNELRRLLLKKASDGNYTYPDIDFAIYLQTVEVIEIGPNNAQVPAVIALREENSDMSGFATQFLKHFATAIGYDFQESQTDINSVLQATVPHKRFRETIQPRRPTRAELWRQQYKAVRTYASLSDDDLIDMVARFLLEEFLALRDGKIGPNTDPDNRDYLGEKLEHLFTECEIRSIDMRRLTERLDQLLQTRSVKGPVAEFLLRNG